MWYFTEILTRLVLGLSVLSGAIPLCPCEHPADTPSQTSAATTPSCCQGPAEQGSSDTTPCPSDGDGNDCPHCNSPDALVGCQPGDATMAVAAATPSFPFQFSLPTDLPIAMLDLEGDRQGFVPVHRRHAYPAPTLRAQRCLSLT